MSHTIINKAKLIARVRRLKGQMEAIERALEAEEPCGEILNLVASVRGAVHGLTVELIEDRQREEGAAELIEVVRRYLK
jgi:FrmR/RcnR family transcriptional regulator, repressor of frmRAB operon